jgi:hypothetical protein
VVEGPGDGVKGFAVRSGEVSVEHVVEIRGGDKGRGLSEAKNVFDVGDAELPEVVECGGEVFG